MKSTTCRRPSPNLIDYLVSDLMNSPKREIQRNHPKANIMKSDDQYKIELAIPGFTKSEIALSIEDDKLLVKGAKSSVKESTENYRRQEFGIGDWSRTFTLGNSLDRENIEAKVENGILTIILHMLPALSKREIKIQ